MKFIKAMKRNLLLILTILLVLSLVIGCAHFVHYTVDTRRSPRMVYSVKNTYAFVSLAKENNLDTIIEEKIFELIRENLDDTWEEVQPKKADYLITIYYAMDEKQGIKPQTGRIPIKQSDGTVIYYGGGGGGSYNYYQRYIRITFLILEENGDDSAMWTADCRSEGSTPNILLPAKYMVPYAIQHFPDEGIWTKKEKIE